MPMSAPQQGFFSACTSTATSHKPRRNRLQIIFHQLATRWSATSSRQIVPSAGPNWHHFPPNIRGRGRRVRFDAVLRGDAGLFGCACCSKAAGRRVLRACLDHLLILFEKPVDVNPCLPASAPPKCTNPSQTALLQRRSGGVTASGIRLFCGKKVFYVLIF